MKRPKESQDLSKLDERVSLELKIIFKIDRISHILLL